MNDLANTVKQHIPHAVDIGMTIDSEAPPGKLRMRIPAQPMLAADPGGHFFFPGILFSLADNACGLAVLLQLKRSEHITTLDMRIDHVAPASLKHDLVAEAECYCITKSVAFVRCELRSGTHQRLVASATGTFMRAPSLKKAPMSASTDVAALPMSQIADSFTAASQEMTERAARILFNIPYARQLGVCLHASGDERGIVLRLPFLQRLVGNQQSSYFHGGVVGSFMQITALAATFAELGDQRTPKLIDFSIDFLRHAGSKDLFARCGFERVGRRVAAVYIRCWQAAESAPVAVARAHLFVGETTLD